MYFFLQFSALFACKKQQGDSLWEIAKKYEPYHHLSNEEFVKWVEHRNNIVDGRVYPGEKIVIPVEKKDT